MIMRRTAMHDPTAGCYEYPREESLADYIGKIQESIKREDAANAAKLTFEEWWKGPGKWGFPLDNADRKLQMEECWKAAQKNK